MNHRVKRVQRLEADHDASTKSAAEMTDAELCRIAGVRPDCPDWVLEAVAQGEVPPEEWRRTDAPTGGR
ncbi:MAG: hypothetical protein AB9M53_06680 [Leptothrix sp. (in: b-proteobacteria)]